MYKRTSTNKVVGLEYVQVPSASGFSVPAVSLFQRLLCLASSLSSIPDGPAKTEGIALGIAAGNTILALQMMEHIKIRLCLSLPLIYRVFMH